MCEGLNQYCNRAKYLAYFGSYARPNDYVDEISDINVVAISEDKSLLLELASEGCSPVVITEKDLKEFCDNGDPLCYYIIYDSKTICGKFPNGITFRITDKTCEKLKKAVIPLILNGIQGFFRYDELSAINNMYRATKLLIRWKTCEVNKTIPLSDEETIKSCETLSLSLCEKFKELVRLRKLKLSITEWDISEVIRLASKELNERIPDISEIRSKIGTNVKSIVRTNKGNYIITTIDGNKIEL